MEKLKILKFPDKILRQKSQNITSIDGAVKELSSRMLLAMKEAAGVGLAAGQVGRLQRLVVIGNLPEILEEPLILINPKIKTAEGMIAGEEGCLSFPGVAAAVRRKSKICAAFWNLDEKEMEIEAQGFLARVIQHELDHLDGILLPDRLSFFSRQKLLQDSRGKKEAAPPLLTKNAGL